jgi:hypothetical protein
LHDHAVKDWAGQALERIVAKVSGAKFEGGHSNSPSCGFRVVNYKTFCFENLQ